MNTVGVPRECYELGTQEQQIYQESAGHFEIVGIRYAEKIELDIKGAQFGWRTWVSSEILWANNIVKSQFIEAIKILTKPQFILGTVISFAHKESLGRLIYGFNYLAYRVISPYILKPKHMTNFSNELHWCIFTFLHEIGISEYDADRFATVFSHITEYDNAYRLRMADLVSMTTVEKLRNTRGEIKRLCEIARSRDTKVTSDKYIRLARIIALATYIPSVKRAFNKVLDGVTIENLILDEQDKYWLCMPQHYKYMGMTDKEREVLAIYKGWKYPEKVVI